MKYWLRYSKIGLLRYVGHLDMLHHWERILRRAELPMAFSQGFSPHQLISLAAPLPVGQQSEAEYLELELERAMEPEALVTAVNRALPPELRAAAAIAVPAGTKPLMGLVRWADYRLSLPPDPDLGLQLADFLAAPSVLLCVVRKGGAKEIDIRPMVRAAQMDGDDLLVCLATGSSGNLRPGDLLRALGTDNSLACLRLELYLEQEGRLITPWEFIGRRQ